VIDSSASGWVHVTWAVSLSFSCDFGGTIEDVVQSLFVEASYSHALLLI